MAGNIFLAGLCDVPKALKSWFHVKVEHSVSVPMSDAWLQVEVLGTKLHEVQCLTLTLFLEHGGGGGGVAGGGVGYDFHFCLTGD